VKKEAKMGHNKGAEDTGRKKPVPCGQCGSDMVWAKISGKMRWFCPGCGCVSSR
jgi:formamidopyrimidine-DNA glycosylase